MTHIVTQDVLEVVRRLEHEGFTVREIADLLRTTASHIQYYRTKIGLVKRHLKDHSIEYLLGRIAEPALRADVDSIRAREYTHLGAWRRDGPSRRS